MTQLKSVPAHSPSIVTRKTGNEYVLVPVTNNIADMNSVYTLNETGAFVWELIDGNKNVGDLIEAVINEYNIDRETATSDMMAFIENMSKYLVLK